MAYVLIKFANAPRPDLWVLERSMDFGHTYRPWQFFACESPRAGGWLGGRGPLGWAVIIVLSHAWLVPVSGLLGVRPQRQVGRAVPVPDMEPTVPVQSLGSLWTGFKLWQLVSNKGGPLSCPVARARSSTPKLLTGHVTCHPAQSCAWGSSDWVGLGHLAPQYCTPQSGGR